MSSHSVFTWESVSEGHPYKLADQISDAVVDSILRDDPESHIAAETVVKSGIAIVAGAVRASIYVDLEEIIWEVILDIVYNGREVGFGGASCAIINTIGSQSSDIAMGVDESDDKELGAGDQGLMFGYASNEADMLMPAPNYYSHRLAEQQAKVGKSGQLPWLRPDAKTQFNLRYRDDKAVGMDALVLSTQHDPTISLGVEAKR